MIEKIVRLALQQRILVAVIATVMLFVGLMAVKKLSVDAFPDVTRKISRRSRTLCDCAN